MRIDVARLPEAVAPLGQHRRQPAGAQVAAQTGGGGGIAEQPQAQRPGTRAGGDDGPLDAELEAHPVAVPVRPDGVAARGLQPRRGRVVALRHAAVGEQVRRAVRAGVGAIGAELDRAAGVVDVQRVARAEPGEVLLGAAIPVGGEAQRLAVGFELEQHAVVGRQREPQATAATAFELDGQLDAVGQRLGDARRDDALGQLERLARHDALGELDEQVVDHALRDPHLQSADQPPAIAADVDGERMQGDLDAESPAIEQQGVADRRGLDRHACRFAAAGAIRSALHRIVTARRRHRRQSDRRPARPVPGARAAASRTHRRATPRSARASSRVRRRAASTPPDG